MIGLKYFDLFQWFSDRWWFQSKGPSASRVGTSTVKSLDACVTLINAIANVARDVSSDVLVLCHGGPIATPADAEFIQTHCQGVDGFYGASSVERLPVEGAIVAQVRSFKSSKVWQQ